MTSNGTGYILVKVTDDGTDKSKNDEGVTIYEEVPHDREVKTSVIKNFSGPKQLKPSSQISVSPLDCLAVSQDNKRFYLVYDLDEIEPKKMVPFQKNKDEDDEDTPDDGVNENFLFEKSLSNTDIQDLINSIKNKLKSRTDEKAKGMLKLAKDIEKTFKEKKSLHPNSVVTIMRMATSVGGKWGVNSKDWNGKPPSGKLNKYPPSPTDIRPKHRHYFFKTIFWFFVLVSGYWTLSIFLSSSVSLCFFLSLSMFEMFLSLSSL